MNEYIENKYRARAEVIKAMAHPIRLYIIDQLSKSPRHVGDLTDCCDVDTSTVSRHLSVLKSAGIISDEKHGNKVYYSLRTPCVLGFFGCVETVLSGRKETRLHVLG